MYRQWGFSIILYYIQISLYLFLIKQTIASKPAILKNKYKLQETANTSKLFVWDRQITKYDHCEYNYFITFFNLFSYLDTFEHLANSKEKWEIINLPKHIIWLFLFLKSLMTLTQICQILSAVKNVDIVLFSF